MRGRSFGNDMKKKGEEGGSYFGCMVQRAG